MSKKKINVVELFAGVAGFRVGLENSSDEFKFIFTNQWEPGKKPESQHAFNILKKHFGDKEDEILNNDDISKSKHLIPENVDLLVGGFPCQDYSVAATNAKGIEGKKGVLWWEINWILNNKKPKFVLLENVDRLIKSPLKNRGRDFAIILKSIHNAGYNAEWRVINAADFGFPQKRKRVFIFAWRKEFTNLLIPGKIDLNNINNVGFFNKVFKSEIHSSVKPKSEKNIKNFGDEIDITNKWQEFRFYDQGIFLNQEINMYKPSSIYDGKKNNLCDILDEDYSDDLILDDLQFGKMKILKGASKTERILENGFKYFYSVGKMNLFDNPYLPGRTMLTSEATVNRSTHIIKISNNTGRFLSPIEAERLNGFNDNWTKLEGVPEKFRYFAMGNSLVTGLVEMMGVELLNILNTMDKK